MEVDRYRDLMTLAEGNEELALQCEAEIFADPDFERSEKQSSFHQWALDQGDRYIQEDLPEPDQEELEKIIDELDF